MTVVDKSSGMVVAKGCLVPPPGGNPFSPDWWTLCLGPWGDGGRYSTLYFDADTKGATGRWSSVPSGSFGDLRRIL